MRDRVAEGSRDIFALEDRSSCNRGGRLIAESICIATMELVDFKLVITKSRIVHDLVLVFQEVDSLPVFHKAQSQPELPIVAREALFSAITCSIVDDAPGPIIVLINLDWHVPLKVRLEALVGNVNADESFTIFARR